MATVCYVLVYETPMGFYLTAYNVYKAIFSLQ